MIRLVLMIYHIVIYIYQYTYIILTINISPISYQYRSYLCMSFFSCIMQWCTFILYHHIQVMIFDNDQISIDDISLVTYIYQYTYLILTINISPFAYQQRCYLCMSFFSCIMQWCISPLSHHIQVMIFDDDQIAVMIYHIVTYIYQYLHYRYY